MRAMDIKAAAYTARQIDRKIMAGSDTVDSLCQRRFYPIDGTFKFDWPNYQYAYPWRLWLDQYELAAAPTKVVSGTYLPTPVDITAGVIAQPVNDGPPYTSIELRRDLNYAFGNNTTPQNDIGITGTFGFWAQLSPAGTIAAAISSTSQATVQVSEGPIAGPGSGDVLVVDSERMLITDVNFVTTGITPVSGATTAAKSDSTIAVADGTQFSKDEILLYDSEQMLIENIYGNNIVVARAWGGTVLSAHSGSALWANRLLSVTRGVLGTTAATHLNGAAASRCEYPGLVKDVAMAHSLIGVVNEPAAYSVQTTASWYGSNARDGGSNKEAASGVGFQGLIVMLEQSRYMRNARSRVI
jgi:hypothetical protein